MTDVDEPGLHFTAEIDGHISDVWEAWTTAAGIESFFAPACAIDIRPQGAYEIYFHPDNEPGRRGAEETMVLAVQPEVLLSFTWNFPAHFTSIREQRTTVIVRLEPHGGEGTLVSLSHVGWGTGEAWDEAKAYFASAWGDTVLPNLSRRFDDGPIDWE